MMAVVVQTNPFTKPGFGLAEIYCSLSAPTHFTTEANLR